MELNKAIQSRRSIRKFKEKTPDWRKIIEAIDATRYAPTAGNNFTLNFIMIDDQEKIDEIAELSSQNFISQAKYAVVFVTSPDRVKNLFGEEKGSTFCKQQAGAAIENFLLKLTEYGLSTCWIGYFNESKIKKLLKIPEDYIIEAIFPIGYANEKPKQKREKDLNNFLYFNEWDNKRMKKSPKIEGRYPEGFGKHTEKD
jgi:nitroreductase